LVKTMMINYIKLSKVFFNFIKVLGTKDLKKFLEKYNLTLNSEQLKKINKYLISKIILKKKKV
jgi:hypothetical protein